MVSIAPENDISALLSEFNFKNVYILPARTGPKGKQGILSHIVMSALHVFYS